MSGCAVSCESVEWDQSISPDVKPNPDIAGIGVLLAFMATAYITLLLVFVYYTLGCVDRGLLNSVDRSFLRYLWLKKYVKPAARPASALQKSVLMFSDQQVVTGIALLISGYAQLPCDIDAYHWQLLVYLVWFSSLTHLTTLTVLRQYLRDNPAIRAWRVVLMLITVSMLGIALLPTGDAYWLPNGGGSSDALAGVPVGCFFPRLSPRYASSYADTNQNTFVNEGVMIVSILNLFFGYMTRLIKLSARATGFTRYWLRVVPGTRWKKLVAKYDSKGFSGSTKFRWKFAYWLLETIYICLHVYYEVYESMLSEILWLGLALAWGSTRLLMAWLNSVTSEKTTWGFGQVVPLVLLALPFLSMGESYYEAKIASTVLHSSSGDAVGTESATHEAFLPSFINKAPVLHIGQWSESMPPQSASQFSEQCLARTGTELSNLEHVLDGEAAQPSIELVDEHDMEPHTREQIQAAARTMRARQPDYNKYEWYHMLIAMVFLLLVELAVIIIAFQGYLIFSRIFIVEYISIILSMPACYAGFFVVMTDVHQPIGDFLERRNILVPLFQTLIRRAISPLQVQLNGNRETGTPAMAVSRESPPQLADTLVDLNDVHPTQGSYSYQLERNVQKG